MGFKKMLRKLGAAAPSLDTVLTDSRCRPGGSLTGEVRFAGGRSEVEIKRIEIGLVVPMDVGTNNSRLVCFERVDVADRIALAPKQERALPFVIEVPWGDTPITTVQGRELVRVKLRTRFAVSGEAETEEGLDSVDVVPCESQAALLAALSERLNWTLTLAGVGVTWSHGHGQDLPLHQPFVFSAPSGHNVYLRMKPSSERLTFFLESQDRSVARFVVSHEEAVELDWVAKLSEWLDSVS